MTDQASILYSIINPSNKTIQAASTCPSITMSIQSGNHTSSIKPTQIPSIPILPTTHTTLSTIQYLYRMPTCKQPTLQYPLPHLQPPHNPSTILNTSSKTLHTLSKNSPTSSNTSPTLSKNYPTLSNTFPTLSNA